MKSKLSRIWDIIKWTSSEFNKDYCFQKAAALTFAAVFALIPILALSFSLFTSFTAFNNFFDKVQTLLIKHFLPSTSSTITDHIVFYTQNTTALSMISLIILIITSLSLFNTVEHTFNAIFKIKRKRPLINKIAYIWSILTLTPLLIATSIYLSTSLRTQPFMDKIIQIHILESIYTNLIPIFLTWITFFLAYQQLPFTKISPKISIITSVTAGSFWEIAKYGFDLYISNVPTYNKIYGSIGIIPIFLLWLYYSWIVVLFGAELTYIMHKPYRPRRMSSLPFPYSETIALKLVYNIGKHFIKAGRPITLDDLYFRINADEGYIKEVLNELYKSKIVARLDEDEESYILAKPLEQVKISEVLGVFKGGILSSNMEDYPDEGELFIILDKIKIEADKITENTTFKDIIPT